MDTPNLPDISSYAAPLYIALILLEVFAIVKLRKIGAYETRDTVTSLLMGTGSVVFPLLFAGTILAAIQSIYAAFFEWRLFSIGLQWWAFVLAFIAYDFVYYWSHRWQHTIRWGWANHVIHHSSQHYNLSTALRQPWFSFISGYFVLAIPLILIGFHPALIAFAASLNLLYQFWIHTEVVQKMPHWFEAVMNTPSHHRVHHGKNPRYLDSNYAGVFIIWDRMFGSFIPEHAADPVRYGLVKDIGTFNPVRVATHEYVAIFRDMTKPKLKASQRLRYLFSPPGWSHDGSRKTSRDIRAEAGFSNREAKIPNSLHPAE